MLNNRKATIPIIIVFIIVNALLISGKRFLVQWEADSDVIIAGNGILFVITLLSFLLGKKGLSSSNPHAFVRSIYTSMLLKLFGCAIAAFIYIAASSNGVNKPALFILMGLYLVYSFIEVSVLTKMLRNKTNG